MIQLLKNEEIAMELLDEYLYGKVNNLEDVSRFVPHHI